MRLFVHSLYISLSSHQSVSVLSSTPSALKIPPSLLIHPVPLPSSSPPPLQQTLTHLSPLLLPHIQILYSDLLFFLSPLPPLVSNALSLPYHTLTCIPLSTHLLGQWWMTVSYSSVEGEMDLKTLTAECVWVEVDNTFRIVLYTLAVDVFPSDPFTTSLSSLLLLHLHCPNLLFYQHSSWYCCIIDVVSFHLSIPLNSNKQIREWLQMVIYKQSMHSIKETVVW